MKNHGALAKLVYTSMAFSLLASFMVLGCSSQTTPTPTTTQKPSSTPTATVTAKPTQAPTSTASSQPQYGGILKIADRGEADALGYPVGIVSTSNTLVETCTAVETLLRTDITGNQVPWLATAFTSDVTAKTITFTLRKGVKFQDGTDFNAAAVKWNLDQFIAAKSPLTSLVASIDIVDDYTVRINLTAWDSTMVGSFIIQGIGLMISPTATQTNGVKWAANHPVGTGPFKFVSWQPGVSMSFSRFDGYWQQGKPYLDSVQHVFISDILTREISLRAGELDVAQSLVTTNFAKLKGDGFVVAYRAAGVGAVSLVPDSANPKSPFADVRVRQAVAYAIDNAPLVKSIFGDGGAFITNQFTDPGNYAYNPSVVGYPYDPAKAKQLLTAAGYPNGFQTRLATYNDTQRVSYYTAVQSYLKAVGIDATIDILTTAQVGAIKLGGTWQGLAQAQISGGDWLSAMNAGYNGQGYFVNMLVPDDYSQALANAISAPDFATKQKFARQAMQLMIDKYCLIIPQYSQIDSVTMWPYVHNPGLMVTNSYAWTPEDAWLGKR